MKNVLVAGSTAFDSIKTPYREHPRLLGGSGSHAGVAASFFAPVRMVGIVGNDFPGKYISLFKRHKLDLAGLSTGPGKTFHWSGEYEVNMNNRRTLATELGVLENYEPCLPMQYRDTPFILLANNAPSIQSRILDQITRPRFVVADTMDLWIEIAKPQLLRLLKKVDALVLNDSEARQLTGQDNLIAALPRIHKLGPPHVIVKKGEHGAILSGPEGLFLAPAYPLKKVVDPTGAGDSFVGGLLGYLAGAGGKIQDSLRLAMIHGAAVASICCEGFGLTLTDKASRRDIQLRVRALKKMASF